MPGTRIQGKSVADVIQGGSTAAVTVGMNLNPGGVQFVAPFNGRVGAVKCYAATAGAGAGSTVFDVLINGATSIWSQPAARPTLAAAATGEANNSIGDRGSFRAGDRIAVVCSAVPATTGHAQVSVSVALQAA